MDWKRLTASALMLGLLALPASAASITPQTTMKEIRNDPDIRASGLYTYTYVWERDCEKLSTSRDDETLAEVVDDTSAELRGGVSTAWELHQQGYAVFSLRYRIGLEAGDDAPMEDLARAIRFVLANADTFGVSTEDYALLGYSSGGQIAGVFGNEEKGWGRYGVPKPGALLMAYPINNFLEAKPAYHLLMDTDRLERRYYSYTVSKLVTPDYPPTFLWYGRNDKMLMAFVYPLQGPALAKALRDNGVPNRVQVYDDAKHGVGIGVGTDAEGWVADAAAFWKSVSEE